MTNNDQELQGKIDSFLRRKEAQYPDLTHPTKGESTRFRERHIRPEERGYRWA